MPSDNRHSDRSDQYSGGANKGRSGDRSGRPGPRTDRPSGSGRREDRPSSGGSSRQDGGRGERAERNAYDRERPTGRDNRGYGSRSDDRRPAYDALGDSRGSRGERADERDSRERRDGHLDDRRPADRERTGGRGERREVEQRSREQRERREDGGYNRSERDGYSGRNAGRGRGRDDVRNEGGGRQGSRGYGSYRGFGAERAEFEEHAEDEFDGAGMSESDGFDDADDYDGHDDGPAESNDFGDEDAGEHIGRVADPNARRVEVRCPVAARCGGCEWLAMPYEEQLEDKQDYIEDLFSNVKCEVEPIIGMDEPWGYRNKVQLPFAPGQPNREGRTTALWGIFERGSHFIVPCRSCLVEDKRARPIIATIAELLPRYNIKPYSEKTCAGDLRYALVRTAHTTGQVMLTLVVNGSRLPSGKAFLAKLLEERPEITTVVLNVNRERTSVILGSEEKVLMGPGYIEDELCGCRFRISSSSFYQTNPIAAEALYNLAVEMADLKAGDRIGDAYCGTGTIGIVAAKQSGAALLGVERNADAVEDARINAELNSIENAEFIAGDAGSVFARMARANESLDVVFMDPPRAGSSQAFLANLSRLGPRRVVYISCEPRTQHHDIMSLVKNGYHVTRIRPVDMFPHTDHVENVVLLERKAK